jgi:hypothetical protein
LKSLLEEHEGELQNIVIFLRTGMIVDAVALLPMTLFLTALRLEKRALDARMDLLQTSFFSFCAFFKNARSSLIRVDNPPDIDNVNDRVTL